MIHIATPAWADAPAKLPDGASPIVDGQDILKPINGAKSSVIEVTDQSFKQALQVTTGAIDGEQYSIGVSAPLRAAIEKDDTLFVEFAIRCNESMTGEATCTFVFEDIGPEYKKSAFRTVSAGAEWTYYRIPFKAQVSYEPAKANARFWLAYPNQTIEIAGLRVVSFGKKVTIKDLPHTPSSYAGREPDAPWRKAAADRIDKLRKADLTVRVVDADGKPRPGVTVRAQMTRHAFLFGTAVSVKAIQDQGPDSDRYRQELKRLFNHVVFENSLKAPWVHDGSLDRVEKDLDWLDANNIPARGHVLVWPAWRWNKHMEDLKDKPDALREAIRQHITTTVTRLKGRLVDWDVLNEPYTNHDFMDILGNAEMIEWFKLARAADPNVKLYINDFGVLESGLRGNRHADHYFKTIQYLLDNGAPFDGIGFQGHVGSQLTPPEQLLEVLNKFSVFDKRFKITELDININNEDELRADYMRDFLTVCFSHDKVDGILHWGFWAKRHWLPNTALFNQDWTIRPHGKAYEDLVFKTWWTDQSVTTDADGVASVRGFLGDYNIIVDGKIQPAKLLHEGTTVSVSQSK